MADYAGVRLAQVPLDVLARDDLDRLGWSRAWQKKMAEEGRAMFLGVFYQGQRIGTCLVSRENDPQGRWLVVNALHARPIGGVDVTRELARQLCALVEAAGLNGLRIVTERRGLARKLEKLGPIKTRYVMEMAA